MWGEVDKILRYYKISSGVHAGELACLLSGSFSIRLRTLTSHSSLPYLTNPHDHQPYQRETNPQPQRYLHINLPFIST
jgi:hypothetical protein